VFHDTEYVKSGTGKSAKRRIFHSVKFDDFEKEIIKTFENSLSNQEIKLPQSWNSSETLKYLYSADFDFSMATSMIQTCLKWRQDSRSSTLTKEVLQMLTSGVIYIWGTDFDHRPTLIINLNKINPDEANEDVFKSALSICMDILRSYCFVGGKVENWNIILDVQNTPLIDLTKIESIMSHIQCCFPQTLEKLFIINISDKQWKIIEPMIGHELNETVFLLKIKEVFKITAYLAPHSLEVKYGGKSPNLQKYWPPPDHAGRSTDSRIRNTPKAGDNSTPSSQNRFDTSYSSQERTTASTTNQPATLNDPFRAEKLKAPPKKQLDSPEAGSKGGYASNVNNSSYRGSQGGNSQKTFDNEERVLKSKPKDSPQRGASAKAILHSEHDQHDPDEQLVRGLLFNKKDVPDKQFRKTVSDRRINQSPPNKVRRVDDSEIPDWNFQGGLKPKNPNGNVMASSSPSKRQQEKEKRSGYSPFGKGGDWDNDVRRQSEPVYIGRDSESRNDSPKKSVTFKSEILDNEHDHVGTPGSNRSPTGKSNLRASSKFIVIEKEEQPKKRLIELPREASDDENDDSDDSGYFCGICVSSRGKKKTV
jgi:hypothetical protein